ncbi:phosphatase PAP2 family protein [soil metagenome]
MFMFVSPAARALFAATFFWLVLLAHGAAPTDSIAPPLAHEYWAIPNLDYLLKHLPGPPKKGSFRDRQDAADAVARQRGVTLDEVQHVQFTYTFSVFTFSEVLGPSFNARNFPKTAVFFGHLASTAGVAVGELKDTYKRLRPFEGHPDQIRLLVRNESGYSYPSGHTTRSRLFAFTLAQLDPSRKAAYFRCAEQVGVDRILAGEHYLTDLEGGRTLGKMLFLHLMKDPKFVADLKALKEAEWMRSPITAAPSPILKP